MGLHGAAQALFVVSLIAALGLAVGQIKIAGVRLGVGGVLFSGLAVGHFGVTIDPTIAQFLREFGLVLFVYAIGVAVGPGFLEAFKRDGFTMNIMAVAVVLLGTLIAAALHAASGVELPAILGILAGATTNTPALAAAQQILHDLGVAGAASVSGMAYAVSYPFGIVGILLVMLLVRIVFRLDPAAAAEDFERTRAATLGRLDRINIEVRNPSVVGCRLAELRELEDMRIVISRVQSGEKQRVVGVNDVLALGDVVHAVGAKDRFDRLIRLIGPVATVDLKSVSVRDVKWDRMVVTRSAVLGRSLAELDLHNAYGVVVTRVNRGEHELSPGGSLELQFGDILTVVGDPQALPMVADLVGNSSKALQETQMVPIFIGIALGMIVGSLPVAIPGLSAPIRLGLAGGPMIAAIALSRLGHAGPLVWFMPPAANHLMRDFGIALFLAIVGLTSGLGFADTLLSGAGVVWMAFGVLVTLVPLMIVGLVGWRITRMNYLSLCGVLAGSMTDPPALAFAQGMSPSDAPMLSYASVYPLAMACRVVSPQIVALLLWAPQ